MTATPKAAIRRLAAARLISITGGAAAYVGLTFGIYERTRSPGWVAATLLLTFGANGFVGPFAGILGDRFDRRTVMIWSDLAGAACFGAMAFASDPAILLGLAFVSAVVEAPFVSSSAAAIPNLVESEDDLGWANSLVQMGKFAGISVGPALGGILYERIGLGGALGLNAASFVVSAMLVSTVHGRFNEAVPGRHDDGGTRDGKGSRRERGLRPGLAFIRRDPVLRRLTLAWVFLTLGLGMSMVADAPLAEDVFDVGAIGFSLIVAGWGLGSVIGSFLGRFLTPRTEGHAIVWGTVLIAIGGGGMGLSPIFWPVVAFGLLMGIGDSVGLIADQSIRQRRTPDAIRSRVMAASDGAWQLALGIAFLLAGPVLALVGPQGTYSIGGLAAAITALALLPMLRSGEGRTPSPPPSAGRARRRRERRGRIAPAPTRTPP
jgi:MFS family permease